MLQRIKYILFQMGYNLWCFILKWLSLALCSSLISSGVLLIFLKPYIDIKLSKMSIIAKINIIHKGFVMITTKLFITYIVIFLLYYLYKVSYAESTDHFDFNHFNNDSNEFLGRVAIYWIEIYSIVVGFLDSNLPEIYKGENFALSISTYIVLIIPAIAFTSFIAIVNNHIRDQMEY